jgi:putative ABC transport system permease protein
MLDSFLQDCRYAWRGLVRTPGFTLAAVLTLSLGIGATTAMFSLVHGVLLRPLPFDDSDGLVMVQARSTVPLPFDTGGAISPGSFIDWEAESTPFDDMAAFTGRQLTLTGRGEPELLTAAAVTVRFFETLQVPAAIGRTFIAEEGRTGSDDVVVLSEGLWRRRFASDPDVVGKPVMLDGRPFTVVGVMPEGFSFPEEVFGPPGRFRSIQKIDLWAPFVPQPDDRRNASLRVFARLRPGVTVTQAQSDMIAVLGNLGARSPRGRTTTAAIIPVHEYIVGHVRPLLLLFFGAVGFVLLIACANVANLLVARAVARQKEVVMRSAVGASRGRLVRQFLTESTLLGVIGGAGGLLLAIASLRAFVSLIPAGTVPRLGEVAVDGYVLGFTVLVSIVAGVAFGLAPIVHTAHANEPVTRIGSTQTARLGVLNVLVASEVAIAVVLVVGAGLLIQSFLRLTAVDPGFQGTNVLTASVTLPQSTYTTAAQMNVFHAEVLRRLTDARGVRAAAVNWLPFGGNLLNGDIVVEAAAAQPDFIVAKLAVSPGYFEVMGIPVVAGRFFADADTTESAPVVIVTDRVARQLWPNRDPLGQRLKLGFGRPEDQPWASVVGVVRDVKQTALSDADMPSVYMPLAQAPRPFLLEAMTFVVESDSNPEALAAMVRRIIHTVDPNLPVHRVARVDNLIAFSVSEPRFRSLLFGGFAAVALVLVATGILGVLTYSVTRRTKEIGLRVALGALPAAIAGLVVRQVLTVTAVGLVVGLGGAFALTRLMRNLLFEIEPTDPTVFAAAGVFLVGIALIASYVPARRAARLDPLIAIRHD